MWLRTAADMVLAPLLVSKAGARKPLAGTGLTKRLSEWISNCSAQRQMIASGCKKSWRTQKRQYIIASACKTLILAKFSKKIWAAETRVSRTQHTHSELLYRLA